MCVCVCESTRTHNRIRIRICIHFRFLIPLLLQLIDHWLYAAPKLKNSMNFIIKSAFHKSGSLSTVFCLLV